jgi:hypothetical protein
VSEREEKGTSEGRQDKRVKEEARSREATQKGPVVPVGVHKSNERR